MLSVGEQFTSFDELSKRVLEFERSSHVQLYIRSSRTIESAARRAPKRLKFNDGVNDLLKYSEIDYACIHGGKNFKTSSTGKCPNQK